jgi:penicillin-binding protein-related factor A (putative recombinase)
MDFKDRGEYKYTIYFYCKPNFLLLEDGCIVDVNIREKDSKENSTLEIIYSDTFFDFNIKNIEKKNTLILIIIHNQTNQFLQQIEIHGESLTFGNHPHIDCINFNFKQITNNKAWKSIPNDFIKAEEVYKSERLSYIRESRINKILD